MNIVLEERKDLLIIQTNDGVKSVPKTDYCYVKYVVFQGNRIFYTFSEGSKVEETFDDGIFNCTLTGRQIQIRDAVAIAKAILTHTQTKSSEKYEVLFNREFLAEHKYDLLDWFFGSMKTRIERKNDKYVIDGIFAVDGHANAYYLKEYGRRDPEWLHLCIVVPGHLEDKTIETPLGCLTFDKTLQSVVAKVMFLMNPNIKDSVFMRQLPYKIEKQITKRYRQ